MYLRMRQLVANLGLDGCPPPAGNKRDGKCPGKQSDGDGTKYQQAFLNLFRQIFFHARRISINVIFMDVWLY